LVFFHKQTVRWGQIEVDTAIIATDNSNQIDLRLLPLRLGPKVFGRKASKTLIDASIVDVMAARCTTAE
jgi:hypothetical protein